MLQMQSSWRQLVEIMCYQRLHLNSFCVYSRDKKLNKNKLDFK